MSMWEPFTEAGRQTMVWAQDSAQRRGLDYIGPDEIFIGVVEAGNNPASEALSDLGVTLERVSEAAGLLEHGADPSPSKEIVFTPRSKRIIELAFEEARVLQHNYIGAEHLMLAFLRECGKQSTLIETLKIEPSDLRANILELMPKWAGERRERASLDMIFTTLKADEILSQQLWSQLRSAAQTEDAEKAWVSAFCIAQNSGWTLREAAAKVQRFIQGGS